MSATMRTQRDDMVRQMADANKPPRRITNRDRKRSQASLMEEVAGRKPPIPSIPSGMDMGQRNPYG